METENDGILLSFLEKRKIVRELKDGEGVKIIDVGIVKVSGGENVEKAVDDLIGVNNHTLLGLRQHSQIFKSRLNNTSYFLKFKDYSLSQSKKFKYLKEEAVFSSEIIVVFVDVFSAKNLDEFLAEFFSQTKGKKIVFCLVKGADNFLLGFVEAEQSLEVKEKISRKIKETERIESEANFVEIGKIRGGEDGMEKVMERIVEVSER